MYNRYWTKTVNCTACAYWYLSLISYIAPHLFFVQFNSVRVQWDNFLKPNILQMERFCLPKWTVICLIQWWFLLHHKNNKLSKKMRYKVRCRILLSIEKTIFRDDFKIACVRWQYWSIIQRQISAFSCFSKFLKQVMFNLNPEWIFLF